MSLGSPESLPSVYTIGRHLYFPAMVRFGAAGAFGVEVEGGRGWGVGLVIGGGAVSGSAVKITMLTGGMVGSGPLELVTVSEASHYKLK